MSIHRVSVCMAAAVGLLISGMEVRADDNPGAEIGKVAPQFTLKSADGKEIRLADYKGKIVVLEWTTPACPFVRRHHGDLRTTQKLNKRFKGKDVVWLAIDSGKKASAEAAAADIKKNELPYPILIDSDGKVGKKYGAMTTPHMFVIDRKGVLAYAGAMDDDARGDSSSPRNYVGDAVQALLDGIAVATSSTKPYGCSVKYAK